MVAVSRTFGGRAMRYLYALCILFVLGGTAPAAGSPARITVARGYGGAVYEASAAAPVQSAAGSGGCPVMLTNKDKSPEGLFNRAPDRRCIVGALTGTEKGFQIILGAEQSQRFTAGRGPSAEAGVLSADADYLVVDVSRLFPKRLNAGITPAWTLHIVVDRDNTVFAMRNGHRVKSITSAYSRDATPCAPKDEKVSDTRWCTTVTIPWDALELPFSDDATTITVAADVKTHGEPPAVPEHATITVL